MNGSRRVPVLVVGACALLAALPLWTDAWATVRAVAGVALISLCPGWAVVRLIGIDDPLEEIVLAIAVSLALATAAAALLMYTGWWSPERAVRLLFVATVTAGSIDPAGRTGRPGRTGRTANTVGGPR